jgi:hypothetical protein
MPEWPSWETSTDEMKNIKITSPVEVMGRHCPEGAVVHNVPVDIAAQLVAAGRAIITDEAATEPVEHRDDEVEHRDPPVTGRRKKSLG